MKISYRTHPILEKLESGILGEMGVAPEDYMEYNKSMHLFDTTWTQLSDIRYAQNIQYITKPFEEAISLSIPKLQDEEMFKELHNEEHFGTLLMGAGTICYWIYPNKNGGYTQSIFRFKEATDNKLVIEAFIYISVDENYKGTAAVFFNHQLKKLKSEKEIMSLEVRTLYSILNFIKYAEVQTKDLPANKKIEEINCKYVNDTKSNIKILDSKWFTTLVKSDAFKVRGHFRLQPKKVNGEWTKELIWINEFQKSGYTAPARKLKEYPEV